MPQKRTKRKAERRIRPRADARLSMRVEAAPDGEQAQIVTESQNISSSGVYCTSSHFMAPLSKVALTIVLPQLAGSREAKELIKCEGIVVRCEPSARKGDRNFELACMFSGLDTRRRGLIEEFVTWRNLQALRAAAGATTRTKRAARPRARAPLSASRSKSATASRPKSTTASRSKSTTASRSKSTTARRRTIH